MAKRSDKSLAQLKRERAALDQRIRDLETQGKQAKGAGDIARSLGQAQRASSNLARAEGVRRYWQFVDAFRSERGLSVKAARSSPEFRAAYRDYKETARASPTSARAKERVRVRQLDALLRLGWIDADQFERWKASPKLAAKGR